MPKLTEPLLFTLYAKRTNQLLNLFYAAMHTHVPETALCGWWYESNTEKIISLDGGCVTITVESTFDTSGLPEIKPNKKYNSKEEELEYVMKRISNEY